MNVMATAAESISVLLGLLALLGAARAQAPWIETKPHRNVCTSYFTSMDSCSTNGTLDTFSGFELELFKQIADVLWQEGHQEWAPGNWSFACCEYNNMLASVTSTNTSERFCDIILNGFFQTAQPRALGLKRTNVTEGVGGFRIIIHKYVPPLLWGFLNPFEIKVWVVMFAAAVTIALVVVLLEIPSWTTSKRFQHRGIDGDKGSDVKGRDNTLLPGSKSVWSRCSTAQYASTGLTVRGVFDLSPSSSGGRLLVLGAAFASIIIVCMYTASYSANVTVNSLRARVTSIDQLATIPVGIFEGEVNAVRHFSLQNLVQLPWNNVADEQDMLRLLRDGTISALLIDAPFADYQTSVNCDMFEAGPMILPTDLFFMFPGDTPDDFIRLIDAAISKLTQAGVLINLRNQFITIPTDCPDKQSSFAYTQIRLHDIGGIWIFLAACIGLGTALNLTLWLMGSGGKDATSTETAMGGPCGVDGMTTVEESLRSAQSRMQKMEQDLLQMPDRLNAVLDSKLASLRADLAAVMLQQLKKNISRKALPQS